MNKAGIFLLFVFSLTVAATIVTADDRFWCAGYIWELNGEECPTIEQWASDCNKCCENHYSGSATENCKWIGPTSCNGFYQANCVN